MKFLRQLLGVTKLGKVNNQGFWEKKTGTGSLEEEINITRKSG